MKHLYPFAVATIVCLAGCTGQIPSEDASQVTESEASADSGVEMTQTSSASDWVTCPEGVDPELAKVYGQVIANCSESDAVSMIDVAMFSTQLAFVLPEGTPAKTRYDLFLQAGKALRIGKDGVQGLPANTVGPIFFNEALGHAHYGRIENSQTALNDAVENGFIYLDMIMGSEELKSVIESAAFAENFKRWESIAAEMVREQALEELANGETFDFEFAGTDVNGNPQSLSDLKGKVVIVDVWGTWCPPCRAEIPSFIRLQEENADRGFQMIGLNYSRAGEPEDVDLIKKVIAETGVNYPCIPGDEATRSQIPGFGGYPTTIFIDRSGKVRMKAVGLHPYEHLNAVVQALLDE